MAKHDHRRRSHKSGLGSRDQRLEIWTGDGPTAKETLPSQSKEKHTSQTRVSNKERDLTLPSANGITPRRLRYQHLAESKLRSSRPAALVIALIAAIYVAACGGDTTAPTAVRVGDMRVDKATVDRWSGAIAQGAFFAMELHQPGTNRSRALERLISASWLIGEAQQLHLTIPDQAVERRLNEQKDALSNGSTEFERSLEAEGRTVSDVRFELRAQLATALIRRAVLANVDKVSRAHVVTFYRQHIDRFRVPEIRDVDLIEDLDSPDAAAALGRSIGSGERFAKMSLHESVRRPSRFVRAEQSGLVRAIFSAKPGTISPPTALNHHYTLFVVRRVRPARTKSLASVQATIVKQLVSQQRQQALITFSGAYWRRWTARTNCRSGFIVRRCAQYKGPTSPEHDVLAGA